MAKSREVRKLDQNRATSSTDNGDMVCLGVFTRSLLKASPIGWRRQRLSACVADNRPASGSPPATRPSKPHLTDSAPHPNAFLPVIVGWTEPSSMADDRVVSANRTPPRQGIQRDYLGVDVVFRLWQCDKENHGWCEGPPVTVLCQSFRSAGRAFTLPAKSVSNEKRIPLCATGSEPLTQN